MAEMNVTPEGLEAALTAIEPELMGQVPAGRAQECLTGACRALNQSEPVLGR